MFTTFMESLKLLKDAARVHPAFKFILGVAAILVVVFIAISWKLSGEQAIVGGLSVIGAMVLLAIFAKHIAGPKGDYSKQAQAFVWFCTFATMIILTAYIGKLVKHAWWPESESKNTITPGGLMAPQTPTPVRKKGAKAPPDEANQQTEDSCPADIFSASTNFENEASGCILDEHGRAMSSVDVYCDPPFREHIKTDTQGRFTCQLPAHVSQRTIQVRATNYKTLTWNMKIGENGSMRLVPGSSDSVESQPTVSN